MGLNQRLLDLGQGFRIDLGQNPFRLGQFTQNALNIFLRPGNGNHKAHHVGYFLISLHRPLLKFRDNPHKLPSGLDQDIFIFRPHNGLPAQFSGLLEKRR